MMFWQDDAEIDYQAPEDVFDLMFKLRGQQIDIDHAYALAEALKAHLSVAICDRIGVHGIRMAGSGNGWNRPEQIDASLPLSRRARLEIRLHRDDFEAVTAITNQTLELAGHTITVGASSIRQLSTLGTLHARAVSCDREQSEVDFLALMSTQLTAMDINVSKLICGKARDIRVGAERVFSRALLVANLKPDESIRLQRHGIGEDRLLGCGLFLAHKGIDAVETQPEAF